MLNSTEVQCAVQRCESSACSGKRILSAFCRFVQLDDAAGARLARLPAMTLCRHPTS